MTYTEKNKIEIALHKKIQAIALVTDQCLGEQHRAYEKGIAGIMQELFITPQEEIDQ
jgi:hypothetical protein